MRISTLSEVPLLMNINLVDYEKKDSEIYVFSAKVPIEIKCERSGNIHTIIQHFKAHASQEIFTKYESIKHLCMPDPWLEGHEVMAEVHLNELYLKHNAYTVAYFFEIVDLSPCEDPESSKCELAYLSNEDISHSQDCNSEFTFP